MARTRIYGKTLSFLADGKEYKCDLSSAVLTKDSAEGGAGDGTLTFCDSAATAGQIWYLNITALQSTDSTPDKAIHTLIWDLAEDGGGEIAFVFAPNGNEAPSENEPHFTGKVEVPNAGYPDLGGDAGENAFTFDYSFVVAGNSVTRVTA